MFSHCLFVYSFLFGTSSSPRFFLLHAFTNSFLACMVSPLAYSDCEEDTPVSLQIRQASRVPSQ